MLSQDEAGPGRLRLVVLQDRLPRHPRRLPGRPAGGDQADPGDRHQHVHLAEHGRPVDRQPVRAAPGRMDSAIATVKNALRDRRDTLVAALERELPEARFRPPQGGYFMWVELPEEVSVAELETAAAGARRDLRQGHRLPARGGREHPPARLLRRDARADRRGRHRGWPRRHGRLASLPEVGYGEHPSQVCELFAPRRRPAPVAVLIHGGFWRARYGRELEGGDRARPRRARLGGVEHRVPAARRRRRLAGRRSTTSRRRSTRSPLGDGRPRGSWRSATPPAASSPCGRPRGRARVR